MNEPQLSAVPAPGEPARQWDRVADPQLAALDANLLIKAAGAEGAIAALRAGEALSDTEQLALGRLNSYCFLQGYEPMTLLIDHPRLHPSISGLLARYVDGRSRPVPPAEG